MKQQWIWSIVGGIAGAAMVVVVQDRLRPTVPPAVAHAPAVPSPPAPAFAPAPPDASATEEGRVVHTFEDDAHMHQFVALWQQREGLSVRRAVIGAYLKEERAALDQLNQQLRTGFQLGDAKEYVVDQKKRALVELPPAAGGSQSAPSAGTSSTGRIVHTFADAAELERFTTLFQQQRGVTLRVHVLDAYRQEEESALQELDAQLAQYHVDPAQDYTLDRQRRVLIERRRAESPDVLSAPQGDSTALTSSPPTFQPATAGSLQEPTLQPEPHSSPDQPHR